MATFQLRIQAEEVILRSFCENDPAHGGKIDEQSRSRAEDDADNGITRRQRQPHEACGKDTQIDERTHDHHRVVEEQRSSVGSFSKCPVFVEEPCKQHAAGESHATQEQGVQDRQGREEHHEQREQACVDDESSRADAEEGQDEAQLTSHPSLEALKQGYKHGARSFTCAG